LTDWIEIIRRKNSANKESAAHEYVRSGQRDRAKRGDDEE